MRRCRHEHDQSRRSHAGACSGRRSEGPTGGRARIPALDVLRGFALCGILLVDIEPLVGWYSLPTLEDPSGWLQLLVQQRFPPIFSLLFGVGLALLLESAQRRGARARLVLLRRLLVLLPSTWLPRWAVAATGVVLLVTAAAVGAGGLGLIPGLFLVGSALVRYGVVDRMGTTTRAPAVLFAAFAVLSVPAPYVTGVLVLLRTPMGRALHAVFVPLGRMALTNYVSATPLVLAAATVLDLQRSRSWTQGLLVAVAILTVQWVVSTLWPRRFRQGPLEWLWLWRWAAWASRPVLRRERPRA